MKYWKEILITIITIAIVFGIWILYSNAIINSNLPMWFKIMLL